jgi:hypothetical protein
MVQPCSPLRPRSPPQVNKLSSVKNQLPYEYYSLPYCRPERIVHRWSHARTHGSHTGMGCGVSTACSVGPNLP